MQKWYRTNWKFMYHNDCQPAAKNEIRKLKTGPFPVKLAQQTNAAIITATNLQKKRLKNSTDAILFMDASHFVPGCDFLGGIYSKVRRFVRNDFPKDNDTMLQCNQFCGQEGSYISKYYIYNRPCNMPGAENFLSPNILTVKSHIILDNEGYQKFEMITFPAGELGKKWYASFRTVQN